MSNSIVAVSIVVIALTLVATDLRENIVKKTFYISIVMLVLGISSTLININPVLGLMINIPIMFLIVYEGVHDYKENVYFPFLLAYIFMGLSAPATMDKLPTRMVAILIGCIYILVIQLVLNNDRFNKTIYNIKKQLINIVINKIDSLLCNKENNVGVEVVYRLTKPIIRAIYDTRLKGKVVSNKSKGLLLMSLSIEDLYKEITNIDSNLTQKDIEFLNEIKNFLRKVEDYFYGNREKDIVKKEIVQCLEEINTYDEYKDIVDTINSIFKSISLIESKDEITVHKSLHIKNGFKPIDKDLRSFKFAIKLSLSLSIIIFLVDIFNITYGRWIIFPMTAIIQPYSDGTVKKSIERIIGTIIGIIIFVIIFSIVRDNTARLNITIVLAYINLFVKRYHISTSLVAVSALGSVAIGGAGVEILFWRVLLTVIGCLIGLAVNRYLYAYTLKDYLEELVSEYNQDIEKLKNSTEEHKNETKFYDNILKLKLMQYILTENDRKVIDANSFIRKRTL